MTPYNRELARWRFPLGGKVAELVIVGPQEPITVDDIDALLEVSQLFRKAAERRQVEDDYAI